MSSGTAVPPGTSRRSGVALQIGGIVLCTLLGVGMVLNNQMGGEAMWFWYATVFRSGVKLYSQLHIALQPLFLLLTAGWMRLVGHNLALMELPSLLQIVGMCVGILLVLRESRWRDWQKAIVLVGVFTLTVSGHSYRFDDYHSLTENLILYALLVLLWMERAATRARLLTLAGVLGLVAGLAVTTRVTDGVALVGATLVCLPFLLRRERLASAAIFLVVTALTVLGVVHLTGDSFSVYLNNTVFHAAASKGGTGHIFAAPFAVLKYVVPVIGLVGKKIFVWLLLLFAVPPLIARFWRRGVPHIFGILLLLAALGLVVTTKLERNKLLLGTVIDLTVLVIIPLLYVLAVYAFVKFFTPTARRPDFDRRLILLLLPLAEWASYSAGAAAEPLTNYYAPMALLLLLFPILQPLWRRREWVYPSYLALMVLLAVSTFTSKWLTPYWWQNYRTPAFFTDRVWYHHPVYGPMYIDRQLFAFSSKVCSDIGAEPGNGQHPELLSLPYPFPNYFCDTPPWHNYVQTFFDTSTRATIEQMMRELEAKPPEWIVYQQQLNILKGAEHLYNHDQPLAQRDLDTMIGRKIQSGQWVLVDESNYLNPNNLRGQGWYIVRTHR